MSYSINKKRNYPRKVGANTENIVSIAVKNYLVQKGCMYHPIRKQRIIYVIEQRQGEELHTSSRELKPESGK